MLPIQPGILPYSEVGALILSVDSKVAEVYKQIKEQILNFSGSLDQLAKGINALHMELNQQIQKTEQAAKGTGYRKTVVFNGFLEVTSNLITGGDSFGFTAGAVKEGTLIKIDQLIHRYHQTCVQLSDQIKISLDDISAAFTSKDASYQTYENASKAYIDAKRQNAKVKQTHDAYLKAKKAAQISHANSRAKVMQQSVQIENLLTQFEQLENWRSTTMTEILLEFSDHLFSSTEHFNTVKSELYRKVHEMDANKDSAKFTDFSSMKPVENDIRYQAFPLPQGLSKVLPPKEVFQDDLADNHPVMKLIQEHVGGPSDHLSALEDEGVAVLGMNGHCTVCKNVNGLIGLVPSEILIPV